MRHYAHLMALVLTVFPQLGDAACRQALALGLDVSASVDLREYRLQLDGLVAALNDAQVERAFLAMPNAPVSLMVYEWSGPEDHSVLVPWTAVSNRQTLREISETLVGLERQVKTPGTALGMAMETGARHLSARSHCWKQTLDISGDGKSNLGPSPLHVKNSAQLQNVTVNALVIGSDAPASGDRRQTEISELSAYFRAEVIRGADAFVQTALGYEDYAAAMTRKLKRELEGVVLGAAQ